MDRSTGSGFACRLKMEQTNVAEDVMVETTAGADKGFKGLETIWISIKHFEHYTFNLCMYIVQPFDTAFLHNHIW
jgi:hypothetical protein